MLADRIVALRATIPATRAALVGLSGIDGSGKGWVAAQLSQVLQSHGLRVANVNIDGWLNLPAVRFDPTNPAEHFYQHAIRFEAMFAQLVLPLREHRSLHIEADFADETATAFRRQAFDYDDVDVIVLEGIFLLKPAFRPHYDLSVWIDCSFETALERALARGQEGLSRDETIRAYRTIYFPAEELHLRRDDPGAAADVIVNNDARLGPLPT